MKVRSGFVSNSSSSSFVCDITGYSYAGYDDSYDCEYAQCVDGHEFDADGYPEVVEYIHNDGDRYDIPAELCPICNGSAKNQIVERFKRDMDRLGINIDDLK